MFFAARAGLLQQDPAQTRFTGAAIEVCDGTPSYVEAHQTDFPTYCPWGARIVSER